MMITRHRLLFLLLSYWFLSLNLIGQDKNPPVTLVGQMSDVMWKGKLAGRIDLDTISNKVHLYGMGPLEFLRGEIVILDGQAYISTVLSDTSQLVKETFQVKAPFFAYANVNSWQEINLPDSITNHRKLESFLLHSYKKRSEPFLFKIEGIITQARIHVVNLPVGAKVSSPNEAHQGQVNYPLTHEKVQIIGFFSTKHQSIFTHHDTFVHMHLLTQDGMKMGHIDEVEFESEAIKMYVGE